jgi:ABC-2 type transport system ATP-binding protein
MAHPKIVRPYNSGLPEPIIRVRDLCKVYRSFDRREGLTGALRDLFFRRYRTLNAVDGVSFDIQRGEIVGYIGANGAGKSTTIKMLTGILTPTSGEMTVGGLIPGKQRYAHARQIGVVFGQRTQLWWDLAVMEAFRLLQKIYRIPEADFQRRLQRFVDVLDIEGQLRQPVRKLSLGQRMKCDLAASLLHAPPILFLDEPTIGLDVAVKERVRQFIREINAEEQSTIILTTHDLTDIEELCERLIILDAGRILYDGTREEIYARFGQKRRVVVEFRNVGAKPASPNAAAITNTGEAGFAPTLASLMDDGGTLEVKPITERHYQLSFDRGRYAASAVIGRLLERYDVEDLQLHEPELNDIVRAIYDRSVLPSQGMPSTRPTAS